MEATSSGHGGAEAATFLKELVYQTMKGECRSIQQTVIAPIYNVFLADELHLLLYFRLQSTMSSSHETNKNEKADNYQSLLIFSESN